MAVWLSFQLECGKLLTSYVADNNMIEKNQQTDDLQTYLQVTFSHVVELKEDVKNKNYSIQWVSQ